MFTFECDPSSLLNQRDVHRFIECINFFTSHKLYPHISIGTHDIILLPCSTTNLDKYSKINGVLLTATESATLIQPRLSQTSVNKH